MPTIPEAVEARLRQDFDAGLIDSFEALAVIVIAEQRPDLSYDAYLHEAREALKPKPIPPEKLRAFLQGIRDRKSDPGGP